MIRNYNNIPEELRWTAHWCLAGLDETGQYKAPYGVGPRGPHPIPPNAANKLDYLDVMEEHAERFKPYGLGFLLQPKSGFTCIDLDIKNANNEKDPKKWTSSEDLARFWKIIQAFDSYTERSQSGQGFHIWVKGDIGEGCKRDGVEVYSQYRFMVCTGDVVINKEIEERQELLNLLVGEIRAGKHIKIELVDIEEKEDDHTIMERARCADNADKFASLWSGEWDSYPSQSEADLALLSIFAFYTKSNTQVRRLFRQSGLGQRAKATKNDRYINDTLRVIRSREAKEEEIDIAAQAESAALMQRIAQAAQNPIIQRYDEQNPLSALQPVIDPNEKGIQWPPGIGGAIAQYIFEYSPRPVKEVAIVSTLGFLAGVCGKAYNIPQSGLNLYVVLIAKSAIGKEAMHSGISTLASYIAVSGAPQIFEYIDFTDYVSGPALVKAVHARPSFVNVSGEWGRKLRRLSMEDGRDGPMQQLRTVMTNLYQKSGSKSIVGGLGYSNKENNISSVVGPAYSMIGETTPRTFYDALTDTMMEDGFLSRFTSIEYNGLRPELNLKPAESPEPLLLNLLVELATHVSSLHGKSITEFVTNEQVAQEILTAFDKECDKNINGSEDEGFRQMWNRAHLKAYRIAALLAVADHHTHPTIQKQHIEWAIDVVRRDIAVMQNRITSGDVGLGDSTREKKLLMLMHQYLTKTSFPKSYQISEKMQKAGVISRRYLQMSTSALTSFSTHRGGQSAALDSALRSLIDNGYIQEYTKDKSSKNFAFSGKCYLILNLPLSEMQREDIKQNNG